MQYTFLPSSGGLSAWCCLLFGVGLKKETKKETRTKDPKGDSKGLGPRSQRRFERPGTKEPKETRKKLVGVRCYVLGVRC